ncbi:unnamed protein product, partial [Rotaria sp. Silwood2]
PGYILLQIVTFFVELDLHYDPSPESIVHLRNMVKHFQCQTCGHSYEKPNPPVMEYSATVPLQNVEVLSETDEERKRAILHCELVGKLSCGVTKQNVIEDNIWHGYPLLIKRNNYGRLWLETVLELFSYDAHVPEIQKSGQDKLDYYEDLKFRSVTGKLVTDIY